MSTEALAPLRVSGAPGKPARSRLRPSAASLSVGLVVALGVLARLHSPSGLWLDEALSVSIARRGVPELLAALRRDGSPPLYYLLLHLWTAVFGDSDNAVRALSTVFSVGTLPLVWCAGRRLGGLPVARAALVLLAVSPFAVRYATETRMYALVQLLTGAGLLALLRALERPTLARLVPVSLCSGLLALTHYWALFLLAVAVGLLAGPLARGAGRPAARRALLALLSGGLLFAPWLPSFAFQVTRTGTPWAKAAKLVDIWYTVTGWAGGGEGPAVVLSLLLTTGIVLALAGRVQGSAVVIGRPLDRTALLLLAGSLGTLLLGLLTGVVITAGYVPRYSSAALLPGLLLAAMGVRALPPRAGAVGLAIVAAAGLLTSLPQLGSHRRTQAVLTAQVLRASLQPGDVVAYCPDQLGPAVSRLLPVGTDQVVYPTFGPPGLIDWVDYGRRNALASPSAFARQLVARTPGAVWLVSASGYQTLGRQCDLVDDELAALRGPAVVLQRQSSRFVEQQAVRRYPAVTGD